MVVQRVRRGVEVEVVSVRRVDREEGSRILGGRGVSWGLMGVKGRGGREAYGS